MSDVILVATIVVFFLIAAQLVRACGRITAVAVEDIEPADEAATEPESRRPA
jgi:hypothetical protein